LDRKHIRRRLLFSTPQQDMREMLSVSFSQIIELLPQAVPRDPASSAGCPGRAALLSSSSNFLAIRPPISTCFRAEVMRDDLLVEIEAVALIKGG
jgi:hypothetical protein